MKNLEESKVIDTYSPKGRGFDGDRYERHDKGTYHAIVKTHQNGKNLKNEHGGYSGVSTGTPKYIDSKWKKLKAEFNNPAVSRAGYRKEDIDESVNSDSETGIATIHKIMRSKGYKKESFRQSALVHHRYTKGDHEIEISQWHGTGHGNRNYGSSKRIHTLFDNKAGTGSKPVIDTHMDASDSDHKVGIDKMIKHVSSLKEDYKPLSNSEFNRRFLELLDIDEERKPLTVAQRRKRGLTIRRFKNVLQRRKKQMEKRIAPEKNLKTRAERLAWMAARRRYAGSKGLDYSKLSPSQKIAIDKIVYKKVKPETIKRISKRLMQAVRRKEVNRVQAKRTGKKAAKVEMPNVSAV